MLNKEIAKLRQEETQWRKEHELESKAGSEGQQGAECHR